MTDPRKSVSVSSNPARNNTNITGSGTNVSKPLRQRIVESAALVGFAGAGKQGITGSVKRPNNRKVAYDSGSLVSKMPVGDKDPGKSQYLPSSKGNANMKGID